ncbi:MAG: hypothetical protein N3E45_05260 [Oscillatoriaceae bacterium SKW80]|nr:hypothetical protein [Oscillatoriaceae bacterium SKW80]
MSKSCPINQTAVKPPDIVYAAQKLIDSNLLTMLPNLAKVMAEIGQEDAALSLRRLAATFAAEGDSYLQTTLSFLIDILQATFESKGNPETVYPLLLENVELLEPHLVYILRHWAMMSFCVVSPQESTIIAGVLVDFGGLIWAFPEGERDINIEIAIACCEMALRIYNRIEHPQEWASTENNLALAYSYRCIGSPVENIRRAYIHYYRGKQIFQRQSFPQEWTPISFPAICPELSKTIADLERSLTATDSSTTP